MDNSRLAVDSKKEQEYLRIQTNTAAALKSVGSEDQTGILLQASRILGVFNMHKFSFVRSVKTGKKEK